jgi:calcineurin-like phosphoesterase family protein
MIWFSSDLHFHHKNILDFCDRPFDDVDEMNEAIITNHNKLVQPDDTWICVGDFNFSTPHESKLLLARMNGFKVLVRGNHDQRGSANKFDICVDEMTLRIATKLVTVKHYPLRWADGTHLEEIAQKERDGVAPPRYLHFYPEDLGQYHIHGHTHSTEQFTENQIHVGVDAWDYKPVSISTIGNYITQRETK